MTHEYLSDLEVVKVEAFVADEAMCEAVRKVILQSIYSHGVLKEGEQHNPYKNRAFALIADNNGNEQLGSNIKAWFEGVNALEEGYNALKNIKSEKAEGKDSDVNQAE